MRCLRNARSRERTLGRLGGLTRFGKDRNFPALMVEWEEREIREGHGELIRLLDEHRTGPAQRHPDDGPGY